MYALYIYRSVFLSRLAHFSSTFFSASILEMKMLNLCIFWNLSSSTC